ncbi:hypothetical protein H5410_022062, partial [Solanum commersonii]
MLSRCTSSRLNKAITLFKGISTPMMEPEIVHPTVFPARAERRVVFPAPDGPMTEGLDPISSTSDALCDFLDTKEVLCSFDGYELPSVSVYSSFSTVTLSLTVIFRLRENLRENCPCNSTACFLAASFAVFHLARACIFSLTTFAAASRDLASLLSRT